VGESYSRVHRLELCALETERKSHKLSKMFQFREHREKGFAGGITFLGSVGEKLIKRKLSGKRFHSFADIRPGGWYNDGLLDVRVIGSV